MSRLVDIDDVRAAARRLVGVVAATPLEIVGPARAGAAAFGVKCEHRSPIRAFKLRGAYNFLSQLTPESLAGGVVTYSSGNHGLAVARSAQLLHARAVVVMPTTAPRLKVDLVRACGAEAILEGTTSLQRKARAEREASARGLVMVPPFDDARIIAGAGTVGLELVEQCARLREVFVPVGGGGLLAGVAVAVKAMCPSARVVGVEPLGAACMSQSLAAGHPVVLPSTASMADGLLPVRPGDLTFAHAQAFVDEVRTVEEPAIGAAMAWLAEHIGEMVEPSGAVGVAAALAEGPSHEGVVAIVTGGNIHPEAFGNLSGRRHV